MFFTFNRLTFKTPFSDVLQLCRKLIWKTWQSKWVLIFYYTMLLGVVYTQLECLGHHGSGEWHAFSTEATDCCSLSTHRLRLVEFKFLVHKNHPLYRVCYCLIWCMMSVLNLWFTLFIIHNLTTWTNNQSLNIVYRVEKYILKRWLNLWTKLLTKPAQRTRWHILFTSNWSTIQLLYLQLHDYCLTSG